jgi:NADH-quinone oxidoreductase subunit G
LLPTSTLFETESTFINQEGRAQFSKQVYAGGIPIEQVGAGDHPPRAFRSDIPGSEPKAAWQILEELAEAVSSVPKIPIHDLWSWLAKENSAFATVRPSDLAEDVRIRPAQRSRSPFSPLGLEEMGKPPSPADSLELLPVGWTFGTEELSAYSHTLQQVEERPALFMHPRDAMRAGIQNKDRVILHLDGGPLQIEITIAKNMAPGIMVLPRHRQLEWQKLKELPARVSIDQIKKF